MPATEVFRWLNLGGKIASGGKNLRELLGTKFKGLVIELERSGKLHRISDDEVDAEERIVSGDEVLTSDDPHVIALARVSGARVVFTEDEALIADFKNAALVPRRSGVRGMVIQPSGTTENDRRVIRGCLTKSPQCK
jgi:hypothetical protein